MEHCPCGSLKNYDNCCGLFISEKQSPKTPEELMRSRYTAYTQANIDYISKTMRSPANDNFAPEEAKRWAEEARWLKLEVVHAEQTADKGFVEFLAHYSLDNKKHIIHELSEFHLIEGKWYYVSGKGPDNIPRRTPSYKIGRNETCPCGSQKKYKVCCGKSI